jgi:hypothetical protein
VRAPAAYAADLRAHPGALRAALGVDSVFIVLYGVFFVLLAQRLATPQTRTLVALGLGFLLATAVLDMVEDHHILALLHGAELGLDPGPGDLTLQHTISQVKFHVSYLGLFLFGLAVPRDSLPGLALALLLTVGTLLQGAWLYAAPVASLPAGNLGRIVGFAVGFALAIPVLRRLPPR